MKHKYSCPKARGSYSSAGGAAGVKQRKRAKSGRADPPHPLGERVMVVTGTGRKAWRWQ